MLLAEEMESMQLEGIIWVTIMEVTMQLKPRKPGMNLNSRRIRGFGRQGQGSGVSNVDPPSLNDMRAKQGAIVAKFMTFFKRKSTIVIEMYEACFYKKKPKLPK